MGGGDLGLMVVGEMDSRGGAEGRRMLRLAEGILFYTSQCGKRLRSKWGFAQSTDSPRLRASAPPRESISFLANAGGSSHD